MNDEGDPPFSDEDIEEERENWRLYEADKEVAAREEYLSWERLILTEQGALQQMYDDMGLEDADEDFAWHESHILDSIDEAEKRGKPIGYGQGWRVNLRDLRISRDNFRINQEVFASLGIGGTVHDVRYLDELRRLIFQKRPLSDCAAIERRIRIAVDSRDDRWMKEFMVLITTGTGSISQTRIQGNARVVSRVRWTEECNGNANLTRKKLKEICLKRPRNNFPHAASTTWTKIHKLAGTDTLPEK
jgi:hypothetical protein